MSRPLPLVLALLSLLALPAGAPAAQRFVGVTDTGPLVTFTSQAPDVTTTPRAVAGLARGERLVAIAARPDGRLLGVGSTARLLHVEITARSATAAPLGPLFAQGLRGTRFSLAMRPGTDQAHLVSDVGQHLVIDVDTGAAVDGPVLRAADGQALAPAMTIRADGRMVGVDAARREYVEETAPGSATFATRPLRFFFAADAEQIAEPLAFALSGTRGYLAAPVRFRGAVARQSRVFVLDGDRVTARQHFQRRQLVAIAAAGTVPDDRSVRASVRVRSRVSARRLLSVSEGVRRAALGLEVRTSELRLDYVASLRVRRQIVGFATGGFDGPGVGRPALYVSGRDRTELRAGIGRAASVVVHLRDAAGNRRMFTRAFTLVP